ncbi:uncharacterized protein LOC117521252 [Thalassophryne amazonica]|uniref:uncharacterized protein LOC117521252 n=1 Tax=Thalassophryne amazonica TaxID=390379 RepID=UPI0014714CA3|nr:uncharacterized protein LOC117521252 [Thalassophryne amazonica]
MSGFLVTTLRDQYRKHLHEHGVKTADKYRAITLKWKLEQKFSRRISIINQTSGSGFICASTVPLGDALEKLRQLEAAQYVDEKQRTLYQAAKILWADSQLCKQHTCEKPAIDISFTAASTLVPDSLFNFTSSLLCDKGPELAESGRAQVDQSTAEKALIMSQQMLQHVSGIPTPLGTANAYHLYNQTRSKSLIKLSNRVGQGISYDRLQRQLTAQGARIMQQVEEDGVFVPENMTHASRTPHVFATDNLDWKMTTLEGGSFHATTAIIIENPVSESREPRGLCVPTSGTQRALHDIPDAPTTVCHISAKDRQKSRSLVQITSVDDLMTESDGSTEDILLVWRLGRTVTTSQLLDIPYEGEGRLPGFSAFCAEIHPHREASTIAYLPLIPAPQQMLLFSRMR